MEPSPRTGPGVRLTRPGTALRAARGCEGDAAVAPATPARSTRMQGRVGPLAGLAALARTLTFRLTSIFLAVVVLAGAAIIGTLYLDTNEIISRQVVQAIRSESDALLAAAPAGEGDRLREIVAMRGTADPARLYLLIDANGTKLAGNLDRWPSEIPSGGGGGTFRYMAGGGGGEATHLGVAVTSVAPGGLRLLVGRDLQDQRRLAAEIKWRLLAGLGLLTLAGLCAGLFASRYVRSRILTITRTSDTIMAGDFSRRVPLSASGDELDETAAKLNAMLDRIEQLMAGLREVSDNIAHDLKTPLSRLRNRAEAALRDPAAAAHRQGLERVIEEADDLIKTFNALLLIARLEAGTLDKQAETFDLGDLARDVADLYSPVAEEAGLVLSCTAVPGVKVRANRQLLGQAIANLLDNAIKYGAAGQQRGAAAERGPDIEVQVGRTETEPTITVADRGPGIAQADRERVLKRFVRLEASRTRPGTGLGLSLVAAVARLHGGRVLLNDNRPGLKATLVLPARLSAA